MATTDAEGRYRLTGLPKGEGNKVRLLPRDDQPYPSVHALVPDSPGLDPVTVDFELMLGIWIEGKLTDKVTGKPVRGPWTISRWIATRTCGTTPDSTARFRPPGALGRTRTVPSGSLACPGRA